MKKGFKANIENLTLGNDNFRHVLYTTKHMQLVLMVLQPGEDIGYETHEANDQFFRFESGEGEVQIGETIYKVRDGDAVVVPAGTPHNVKNTSLTELLKLYTIYTPSHHRDGVSRKTKADAQADAPEFEGTTTEQD